ncbi:fido (protein-threonine AMPylation protein) [Enterococcus sp. PF1-24]|nr:Fic family protein [Enterococcus sp. PF1-24]MDH6401155.1 fido (protein-threonine AMPylation protein) [Enterococcus sp. PF1-24]
MYFDGEKPYEVDEKELLYQTKLDLWQTGFGLQAVDGLKPSDYMLHLAKENIEGKKSYQEVAADITKYHDSENINQATKEADIVSLRIAELLSEDYFLLKPSTLLGIHRHLFTDVFEEYPVGQFRVVNITKNEEVLNGESVQYASHFMIRDTLNFDFSEEQDFSFEGLSQVAVAKHIMDFISNIWQVHPFREGNTRTIAVFAIKYFKSLGFDIDNEPFKKHSQYFRDALVLANATGKLKTQTYLAKFTENVLLAGENILERSEMLSRLNKTAE